MALKQLAAPKNHAKTIKTIGPTVHVDCCREEILLALRVYLGGVKTGLGKGKKNAAARARLSETNAIEKTLKKIETEFSKCAPQSSGIIIQFHEHERK